MTRLYKTLRGPVLETTPGHYVLLDAAWDDVLNTPSLAGRAPQTACAAPLAAELLAPIGTQEVWASGVTYYRSRDARMEEAQQVGGGSGDFYAKVYAAERPELFFKSTAARVVGTHQPVRIRKDSQWNVPEPELVLVISHAGDIVGYTVGNDMGSRDIEGENPLYLPQAKVYEGGCAMGPCILLSAEPLWPETAITIAIARHGATVFSGETKISQIKRALPTLVEYLYRELNFPAGCFLFTGTGIVPDGSFTLESGDEVTITIDSIGTLVNTVA